MIASFARAALVSATAPARRRSLIDPSGECDVALTTFGPRLARVHHTIQSIGWGRDRPRRLYLYLDDAATAADPLPALARLVERGLTIVAVDDFGPHKKYLPYVEGRDGFDRPLVTADDDVYYHRSWLADLLAAHRSDPTSIVAHRAHHIALKSNTGAGGDGIEPYERWVPVRDVAPSHLHLATGVGGVLHPPAQLDALRAAGRGFTAEAPRTDDLWLHRVALRAGIRVRQVTDRRLLPPWVPGLADSDLTSANVAGGGNDRAVIALYDASDIERLQADVGRCRCQNGGRRLSGGG